jgi:predicted DNA-binding protein (MmcQ/YjbR family)
MPREKRLSSAESALRRHALAYPEAYEEFPWGHVAVKVKGKVFLFLSNGLDGDDVFSLSLKLPLSGKHALTLPFASPTGYGLGKSGWVSARFVAGDDVPLEMLQEWVDESFRAIAPKRVLAKFEEAEADQLVSERASQSKANRNKIRTPGRR